MCLACVCVSVCIVPMASSTHTLAQKFPSKGSHQVPVGGCCLGSFHFSFPYWAPASFFPERFGFGFPANPPIQQVVRWVWVKIKPPGIGPQVLVFGSIYQGFHSGVTLFLTHSQWGFRI